MRLRIVSRIDNLMTIEKYNLKQQKQLQIKCPKFKSVWCSIHVILTTTKTSQQNKNKNQQNVL